ncbi:hypothetical protein E1301_Tti018144 [Triplophysa tibetana]|uniref:Uncharacterized protein n=1 Tax=Triplophysa tibetana TaxID=1572043 RepID=A0A5A9PKI2_9TELE|nr:hypothetical protein E1301_Tti018144 [Triplophysa tibetana]
MATAKRGGAYGYIIKHIAEGSSHLFSFRDDFYFATRTDSFAVERALQRTGPPCSEILLVSAALVDSELFWVLAMAVEELDLEWSSPEEPTRSRLDEWFLPGRRLAPRQRTSPFFPNSPGHSAHPIRPCLRPSSYSTLTSVDGAEEKGCEKLPPLYESVAAHLCPPSAIGWKAKASHPSKSCKTTLALAGRAFSSARKAASALHSMAELQLYQAKLLQGMDESSTYSAPFKELRSARDMALRATA